MKIEWGGGAQLTYCTNVHPGESWGETLANIQTHGERIRELAAPGERFGIGLRLSDAASVELSRPEALAAFKDYLAERSLYVFTLNGFPFGRFHATKVKEEVYAPDWTHPERVAYTDRLGEILAELLPDGMEGSISTSPGTFKEWITGDAQLDLIAENMALCAGRLHGLRERTGKSIILAPEPEPLCMMETMKEAAQFFERRVRGAGARLLSSELGIGGGEARSILARHLGVCYDACHMAVEFEGAEESLRHLEDAGVPVGKYQISSALRLSADEASLGELRRFADAVYLHQVIGRMPDGSIRRWKDITPALADAGELARAEELRVHCHVPLFMTEHRGLRSTSDHVDDLLAALALRGGPAQFEIETYTWDVLPNDLKQDTLDEAVAKEFRWLLDRMQAVERPSRA